jgi:cold shock CspA family protein
MPRGTIKTLLREKGFGFIRSSDSPDEYFFHCNGVARGYQFDTMQIKDTVEFKLRPSRKKTGQQEAFDVTPVQSSGIPQSSPHVAKRLMNDNTKSNDGTILPYGFVPINLAHSVTDVPIWHDGWNGGELLSGEIFCELEALTPLLPGNMRYKAKDADPQQLHKWGFGSVDPEKQIAEPLRLPDGRVVIAGSALKGLIRHSLGALAAAPMERVAEHHYSYRPNLDFRIWLKITSRN